MAGSSRRVAVEERAASGARQRCAGEPGEALLEPDGLWGVALLRVALELKRPGALELPQIVDGVAARMRLPREQLVAFVERSFGPLAELARANRA